MYMMRRNASSTVEGSRVLFHDSLHLIQTLIQTSSSITLLGNTNNLLLADPTLSCSPHQPTSASHRDIRSRNSMDDSHSTALSTKLHRSTTPPHMIQTRSISELDDSSSSPIYKALDVTELCENILGNLPFLDLWRARSVCKTFQAVIDHSPSLLVTLNSFLNPRARAPATTYQIYLEQHEIHPLFKSTLVRDISDPSTSFPWVFLDQEKPKLMRLFYKKDKFNFASGTFKISSATGTGFADDSPLLDMFFCNPPSEAVHITTRATFWDPVTLVRHCREMRSLAVIKLRGVTIGDVLEKAISKAVPREHEGTVSNYLWEMEVRVNRLWGAVGPDFGSHIESADEVGQRGELMWSCCDLAGGYLD
jgi:hypothetical protein